MFFSRPKLPVTEEERAWVDEGFHRLGRMLGWSRLQSTVVVQPTDEFFPDPYDSQEAGLRALFQRVCGYMEVNPHKVDLEIIPDSSELFDALPEFGHHTNDPAGLHFGGHDGELPLIAVRRSLLKDPLVAIATLAHELGHVILLDGNHISREAEDMEPMTDLVTVFLGLGLFTANASRRFTQYQDERRAGWSMKHQGYLPEPVFAYALAFFAKERGEDKPAWQSHLSTNLKTYFRQSADWLRNQNAPIK